MAQREVTWCERGRDFHIRDGDGDEALVRRGNGKSSGSRARMAAMNSPHEAARVAHTSAGTPT